MYSSDSYPESLSETYTDQPSITSLISHSFQLIEIIKLTLILTRKWAQNSIPFILSSSVTVFAKWKKTELLEGTIIKSDYEELCNIKCLLKLSSTQYTLPNSPQTVKTPFVETS